MHTCKSITSDSDSSGRSTIMLKINFYVHLYCREFTANDG
jgi:hypothetical protein